jgi:hypothetical protein
MLTSTIYALIGRHHARMKNAVICTVLFAALFMRPAVCRTSAEQMLEDAAVNHDLARIRLNFKRQVESEGRLPTKHFTFDTQLAKPGAAPVR